MKRNSEESNNENIPWFEKYTGTSLADDPSAYDDLPKETRYLLDEWIGKHFKNARSSNNTQSSYSYKHEFQRDTDIYIYNGAFKGAMLEAGYKATDMEELNWHFKAKFI